MSERMEGFPGFPAGKLTTTPVPNLFFSELLPLIDNVAELKVILHLFWLIGKKRGVLRYARLDELLKDRRLLDGLATAKAPGELVLRDALERAVARGALLRTTVDRDRETEEWYMINSANGREVLERLQSGELDLLGEAGEDVQLQMERPTVFVLYEQNIGMLTPMIADELRDAERHYPAEWIADAFRQAVLHNKRSWKYVLAILERWRTEGRSGKAGESASPMGMTCRRGMRTWSNIEVSDVKRLGDLLGDVRPPEGGRPDGGKPQRPTPPEDDVCPICKGKGFLLKDVPYGHPEFGKLIACRCTEARIALNHSRELHGLSNLGGLNHMTFDTFLPDGVSLPESLRAVLHRVYDICLAYARDPRGWLVLLGGYGAGKTHLAAAIANYNVELGRSAMFVVTPDLLDHLRAAFGPTSESGVDERLETIRETPLLVLDDLGAHHSTPWAQEKLFQILNHRYNRRLPTVITTNQRLEELDPRIASRLVDLDLNQVFEITAPDFRKGSGGHVVLDRSARNLSSLGLHTDQTFENFSLRRNEDMDAARRDNLARAVDEARSFARLPSGWLVLSGRYGCGKTHLAAAIANHQLNAGQSTPMFVVVPDLLDHLRATFSPTSSISLDRVFEQVKTAPLLILDDLGTESATPWAREKLFQLLNYRYAAKLPTVITTTAEIDEIDERLQSRMLDASRCTFFIIQAPSYHGSAAQRRGADEKPVAPRSRPSSAPALINTHPKI